MPVTWVHLQFSERNNCPNKNFNCLKYGTVQIRFCRSNKTNWEIEPMKLTTYSELQIILFNANVKPSICYHEKTICWTANKVQRTWVLQPNTFSMEKGVYCKLPSLLLISTCQWFRVTIPPAKQSVCWEFLSCW